MAHMRASFYLGHQIGAKKTSAVAAVSSGLLGLEPRLKILGCC